MKPQKKREYKIKKTVSDPKQVIALPMQNKDGRGAVPMAITLDAAQLKSLQMYIRAKRAVARHEAAARAIVEEFGKVSTNGCTLSPRIPIRYSYPPTIKSDIEALDERKKAFRESGEAEAKEGKLSISFSDTKKK